MINAEAKTLYEQGEKVRPGLLWVLGFNNGETLEEVDHKPGWSTHHWIKLCEDAAGAVKSPTYVIRERIFWGSPNAGELKRRVGSYSAVVNLLKLHAQVNRILLKQHMPLVVWLTGLSYLPETEQAYGLTRVGEAETRENGRGRLWQAYKDEQRVPWLATHHPSDRLRRSERERITGKLAELAALSSART